MRLMSFPLPAFKFSDNYADKPDANAFKLGDYRARPDRATLAVELTNNRTQLTKGHNSRLAPTLKRGLLGLPLPPP